MGRTVICIISYNKNNEHMTLPPIFGPMVIDEENILSLSKSKTRTCITNDPVQNIYPDRNADLYKSSTVQKFSVLLSMSPYKNGLVQNMC